MNSVGLGLAWLRHSVFVCDWLDSVDSAGLNPTGLASVNLCYFDWTGLGLAELDSAEFGPAKLSMADLGCNWLVYAVFGWVGLGLAGPG